MTSSIVGMAIKVVTQPVNITTLIFCGGFWSWSGWNAITALTTIVIAIATTCYTFYTARLLKSAQDNIKTANENKVTANKLAEFQIYMKITEMLNRNKAFQLLELIGSGKFKILESQGKWTIGHEDVPEGELRKYVLNPLEDLAKFYQDGLITDGSLNTGFGSNILMVAGSKQVVEYIIQQRTKITKDSALYRGIESLVDAEFSLLPESDRAQYKNYFRDPIS